MSMTDVATLGFQVDTGPLSAAEAALNRLAQTGAACEAAINKMAATTSAAFTKLGPAMQAAVGGGSSTPGGLGTMATGAAAAATAQQGLAAATASTTTAVNAQAAAVTSSAHAHSAHGAAAYGNRLQMLELAHVARALFDEMAAGGNIFRGLAMESGRLQIALSSGEGGLTGLVGRLGSGMSAMLNPIGLATAGIAALGVTAAVAFGTFESGQDRLVASLNGIGRRSGATVGQLNSIVQAGAAQNGLSNREGIGLAAGYTAAGLTPDVSQSLFGAARTYGRVTDQSTSEAGSAIASAMRDPIAGLSQLDKSLGFVDDALKQNVTNLERSGHIQEAQAMLADALNKALHDTTDTTWSFRNALNGAENFLSNKFGNIGNSIAGLFGLDSPQEQLKRAQSMLPYSSNGPLSFGMNNTTNVQAEINRLQKIVDQQDAKAEAGRREGLAVQRSTLAGDAVRSILPDLVRSQTAANQLEVLRQALSDSTIMDHIKAGGIGPGQVSQAFSNAVVMQSLANPHLQQRQDYDLRIASADAYSVGEKAIIEARRAELEVLRQTGDVARAATAAQMSMNEAIAKGNSDAEDRLQIARQNADMVGLTGLARSQQEIRNKYEGYGGIFDKDATTGTNISKIPDIQNDLAAAGHRVQMALNDLSPRLDNAGSKLVTVIENLAGKLTGAAAAATGVSAAGGATLGSFDPSKVGSVTGSQMAMMQAYIRAGYSPAAAAGFVGATTTESGINLNPAAVNPTSGAFGVFQDLGSRKSALVGHGDLSFGGQIANSLNELSTSERSAGRMLSGSDSVLGGVMANEAFERPGDAAAMARRGLSLARGNALLSAYQGGSGAPPLTVGVSGAQAAAIAPIAPDMLGKDQSAEQSVLNADVLNKSITPLINSQQQITALNASLKVQADTFGQTADKIQAAAYEQKLLNDYQREGVTITPALAASVKGLGDQYGDYYKRQQDQQNQQKSFIGTEDSVRGFTSNSLDSVFTGLAQHKPINGLLRGVGQNLGESLIRGGVGMFTSGLFGKSGQAGGGLFGGALGSLLGGGGASDPFNILPHFAGGTQDAPGGPTIVGESGPELVRMPPHAQVVSNAALENMRAPVGHTFQFGDTHIHPVGGAQFTPDQISAIRGQVVAGQQDTMQQIVRNLPQIQSDANQSS